MQDEESLVQQAKQGNQAAFAQLYEGYFEKIYRYLALKIGDRMEAEDMTQQVFLSALRSLPSFKWKGVPFAAWLFRIAHNQMVDYLRRKSKQPATFVDAPPVSSDSDPQLMVERSLDIERLLSATRRLSEAQREVLSLRFAGGLSIIEVAETMGKSQGAVKALQHSAIRALRKVLSVENK